MKILLHGATNWGSSNFGDFIYADKIAKHIRSRFPDAMVELAEPSDYFKQLMPFATTGKVDIKNADALIYIPGGYFGEGHSARIKDNLIHFLRFMPVGLKALKRQIPIAVIGIGAGPNHNYLLTWAIKKIVKGSVATTVRDRESYDALRSLGCDGVSEGSDMILTMDLDSEQFDYGQINQIKKQANQKKILLVHYNHSAKALDCFGKSVTEFLSTNPEYKVVVCYDQLLDRADEFFKIFKSFVPDALRFEYWNPYELVGMITASDSVLTCKLHVGVVASMKGKSVICAAEHPEKTMRYYRQIGEKDRCVSLYDTGCEQLAALLRQYHMLPVGVSSDLLDSSQCHWEKLDSVLTAID